MKNPTRPLGAMLFVLVLPVALSPAAQQAPTARPAVAIEPIAAILDAFRTHDIVALGEPHGNEQGHAFRLSLIRDLRLAETVNDILWECGSARYQDVMDRFIQGEDVPDTSLRQAWRNTVGSISVACDLPIYEEFIRAVRAVNAARPRERRLRVLLGDPPIDWDKVHALEDAVKWRRFGTSTQPRSSTGTCYRNTGAR